MSEAIGYAVIVLGVIAYAWWNLRQGPPHYDE